MLLERCCSFGRDTYEALVPASWLENTRTGRFVDMFRAAYRDPALPILALIATLKAVSACRCHGWRRNAWRRDRAGLHSQFHMVHVLLMRRGGFGRRGEPPISSWQRLASVD